MSDEKNQSMYYYAFSFSNFLAAVGGGMILGKGVKTIQVPFLQGSSLLAFFAGTLFGLILLELTPKKFSTLFSRWFSISGGMTSLVLLCIFLSYQVDKKLYSSSAVIFFILLSARFGFWFFSRVLRASTAAGKQRIAWVEFGYYAGVIVGLVLWLFLGIDIGMASALLVDAFLQFIAGFLDLFAYRMPKTITNNQKSENIHSNKKYDKIWGWRLAVSVMLLTIAVQVIIFNLAHQLPEQFSPFMLAIFYLGSAIAAIFCKHFNIRLEWSKLGYATIFLGKFQNRKMNFFLLNLLSASTIALTIFGVYHLFQIEKFLLLVLVFISTFIYGIIELAILDRIGLEEIHSSNRSMVFRTYGLMSIAAVISLWLLQMVQDTMTYVLFTLVSCFLFVFLSVWKRNVV